MQHQSGNECDLDTISSPPEDPHISVNPKKVVVKPAPLLLLLLSLTLLLSMRQGREEGIG